MAATAPHGSFAVQLGASLRPQPQEALSAHASADTLHTFRYDSKPESAELARSGEFAPDPAGGAWTLVLDSAQGDERTHFAALPAASKDVDCLLIFDPETQTFVLERVDSAFQLRLQRRAGRAGAGSRSDSAASGPSASHLSAAASLVGSADASPAGPRVPLPHASPAAAAAHTTAAAVDDGDALDLLLDTELDAAMDAAMHADDEPAASNGYNAPQVQDAYGGAQLHNGANADDDDDEFGIDELMDNIDNDGASLPAVSRSLTPPAPAASAPPRSRALSPDLPQQQPQQQQQQHQQQQHLSAFRRPASVAMASPSRASQGTASAAPLAGADWELFEETPNRSPTKAPASSASAPLDLVSSADGFTTSDGRASSSPDSHHGDRAASGNPQSQQPQSRPVSGPISLSAAYDGGTTSDDDASSSDDD
ncbi:hypothetical protein HK105_200451 [Polyrhizophydium stewartii]|uniref:Transcription elongation factor Eaf N-terminal domain-containing protein n=1 Tax=Polyrhizophydium stewartii TaxID=2732419 RepID=A0ABR4NLH0_9FUNG